MRASDVHCKTGVNVIEQVGFHERKLMLKTGTWCLCAEVGADDLKLVIMGESWW